LLSASIHTTIPRQVHHDLEVPPMTVAEQIMQHINALPETAQTEVLDFVEYLESKKDIE